MKNLTLIYDERCLLHKAPFSHPENPDRIAAILKYLSETSFLNEIKIESPIEAAEEEIIAVHSSDHFNFVKRAIENNVGMLDSDTYIVKDSWLAAMLSAGSAKTGVDLVMNKSYKYVFSLMRPPGHHAESKTSMGFCLFNNAAIGAQHAINKHGLERIAIIDWDVHHGNGTQEIFYESSKVLYISLHQFPLYPGTGTEKERGKGEGEGFTLNFPLPSGTDGKVYLKIFEEKIIKELEKFLPQMLFISAGFDAHKDDPLANMNLTEKDFADMTTLLKDFAVNQNIPIISLLEGGYNLTALSKSVLAHLQVLNS